MNQSEDRPRPPGFVVFSDDWGMHPSSCQHLFRHISRNHRVGWINTIGMRPPSLSWTDARKIVEKASRMLSRPEHDTTSVETANVDVFQPAMLPYGALGWCRRVNRLSAARAMRRAAALDDRSLPIVLTTVPNSCDYVDAIESSKIVYYCVDDFSEWPGLDKSLILEMEAKLIEKADIFVATSSNLFDRLSATGKPTHLLTHGVDIELFSSEARCEHPLLAQIPTPRAGYFGLFDGRSDQDLLAALAQRMPDVAFVVAGRVEAEIARLADLPNVFFIGALRYDELPALVAGLDVLFLPYEVNALSNALSPLKLKEYLVTGKPVVSTPIAASLEMHDCITVVDSIDDWQAAVRSAIAAGDRLRERREAMAARLAGESWRHKAEELLGICGIDVSGDGSAPVRAATG